MARAKRHERAVVGMTVSQVSQRLGLSVERIRQLGHSGALPYVESPLGKLYDPYGVQKYLRRNALPTKEK